MGGSWLLGDGRAGGKLAGNGRCCERPLFTEAVSDMSVSDFVDCAEVDGVDWSDARRDELGEPAALHCCCSGRGGYADFCVVNTFELVLTGLGAK